MPLCSVTLPNFSPKSAKVSNMMTYDCPFCLSARLDCSVKYLELTNHFTSCRIEKSSRHKENILITIFNTNTNKTQYTCKNIEKLNTNIIVVVVIFLFMYIRGIFSFQFLRNMTN